MNRAIAAILTASCVLVGAVVVSHAQQPDQTGSAAQGAPTSMFAVVDVYIDSGTASLAAYQFELTADSGEFRIVGVEGGEHRAFAEPPYYDPAALMNERIIIASFNTGTNLPTGRTRVARVHVQILGNTEPAFVVELDTAATADGSEIEAKADVQRGAKS